MEIDDFMFVKKPLTSALLLLLVFSAFVLIGDFKYIIIPILIVFIYIFNYVKKTMNMNSSILFTICFLSIFDSEIFTYTVFKIRIWYFLIVIFWIYYWTQSIKFKNKEKIFTTHVSLYVFTVYCSFSFIFLFFDEINGILSNFKYLLFSISLIYIIIYILQNLTNNYRRSFFIFLFSIACFVCFWGLLQVLMLMTPFAANFMLHYFNFRPEAFFSETTWYGLYCVWGVLILSLCIDFKFLSTKYAFLYLPFIVGIILTLSRNAILGFFIFIFLKVFFKIFHSDIRIKKRIKLIIFINIFALLLGILYFWDKIGVFQNIIISKITLTDASGLGRFEAFRLSFNDLKEVLFTGGGFTWHEDQVTNTGTFMGSKSFNLFFMIGYIFGIYGLVILCVILLLFYFRNFYLATIMNSIEAEYSLIIMSIFLIVSMFTPLHQFPLGIIFVSISIGLPRVKVKLLEIIK